MEKAGRSKGLLLHRFLVLLFTGLLTLLVFWLLSFVVDDIGSLPGPQLADVEKHFVSEALLRQNQDIDRELAETGRKISEQGERQKLLRDSTSEFQRTMNQLMGMQRPSPDNALTDAQRKALSESLELFLANQKRDQQLTEDISKLSEQQRSLQEQQRALQEKLNTQRQEAQKEWNRLDRRHQLKIAGLKLAVLLPMLAIALYFFLKKRTGMYAPLVYATGAALLWQTILVIHEYFPTRYFKYLILLAVIAIVAYLLVSLLRLIRAPKPAALLKQYREAYESFLCPVCEYPIRRGPMRYLAWNRRSIRRLNPAGAANPSVETAYSCPACGSQLFEPCSECKTIRHSLLPFCENCRAAKSIEIPQSV